MPVTKVVDGNWPKLGSLLYLTLRGCMRESWLPDTYLPSGYANILFAKVMLQACIKQEQSVWTVLVFLLRTARSCEPKNIKRTNQWMPGISCRGRGGLESYKLSTDRWQRRENTPMKICVCIVEISPEKVDNFLHVEDAWGKKNRSAREEKGKFKSHSQDTHTNGCENFPLCRIHKPRNEI